MSYPAQNTDTEFQALVEEISNLHNDLESNDLADKVDESFRRLKKVFSRQQLKEYWGYV